MAAPSITHTFTNGTTADGSQVNTNFTDLINGASDGTKDYSISALTCAGTATFNGNTNIGNSSSDDLSITASLASTLAVKTTGTYYIGSATKALLGIYFGNASNSNTALIQGGVTSASYSLTLPLAAPSAGQRVVASSSSVLAFDSLKYVVASKVFADSPYTVLATDEFISVDCTNGVTVLSLPTAVGVTGKTYTIKKIDSTFNAVTVNTNSTETIDGVDNSSLNTQYESMEIVSNGTNWLIKARDIPSLNATNTNLTITGPGTTSTSFRMQRRGNFARFTGKVVFSGAGSGTLVCTLSTLSFDTGNIDLTTSITPVGMGTFNDATGGTYQVQVCYTSTDAVRFRYESSADSQMSTITNAAPVTIASTDALEFWFEVPITGWKG